MKTFRKVLPSLILIFLLMGGAIVLSIKHAPLWAGMFHLVAGFIAYCFWRSCRRQRQSSEKIDRFWNFVGIVVFGFASLFINWVIWITIPEKSKRAHSW